MPGTAGLADPLLSASAYISAGVGNPARSGSENALLLSLQRQALQYFLDNQMPNGLVLDRQDNHGPRRAHGLCSSAATGMGFIALALAAAPPYCLHSHAAAVQRIRLGLQAALERLPQSHGMMPHFVDAVSGAVYGVDHFSTIDSAWLVAGALWAAAFLGDPVLEQEAQRLYQRIDWRYWTAPEEPDAQGLLRHGQRRDGSFLRCSWDRLNGETIFMYVLAAGADPDRALDHRAWQALQPFYGTAAGQRFPSADLGLFVFQYGMDLVDLRRWRAPGAENLWDEVCIAAQANYQACREQSDIYATYRRFWGLSAGDGPGVAGQPDTYRCYSPREIDGTAHITATLASTAGQPDLVLENVHAAEATTDLPLRGRYGYSNVHLDQAWVSRDLVGIDAGAAVLALDNYLMAERVRLVFNTLPCVQAGLHRLGFVAQASAAAPAAPALRIAS